MTVGAENGRAVQIKAIVLFWIPLASTWLMMAAEQPVLAAVIARLDDPVSHLAAFGVAYAVALIFEAPIIMILSAVTALVHDRLSMRLLFRFTLALNAAITVALVLVCLPPVYSHLAEDLLKLPESIHGLTHRSLLLLIPWPAAIGFRRFFQGLLIVNGEPKRVAMGTVFRLITMGTLALVCYAMNVEGAITGAVSLSAAVVVECLATWKMAAPGIRRLREKVPQNGIEPLNRSALLRFYYPLALTSFLSLGIHPITTFFVSKSRFALESLAVLPVVNALVFIFRSLGLSFQEVAITFLGRSREAVASVVRFSWYLALTVFAALALLAWTPLGLLWYSKISGLNAELSGFAMVPTQIMVLLPSLTVWISFQRAALVKTKKTAAITVSSTLEIVFILVALWLLVTHMNMVGATAAAISLMLGRLVANTFLWFKVKHALTRLRLRSTPG